MEEKKYSRYQIIIFSVIVILIILLTLSILLPKFPLIMVKKVFNYVVENIVNVSGLSQWLVKGITVFALIPFYWALMEVSNLNFRLFKRKSSHKKLSKFIIFSYAGIFFLSMFFLSRGTYFGHNKGEATKYYANTPEGIRFFDSPGYDPKYGIKLEPVTPDLIEKHQKKLLGMQPKKLDIKTMEGTEFFDPITGDTKVWYFTDSDGNYEFYDAPGFHPVYKVELKPVTPEIIRDYQRKLDENKLKKAIEQQKAIQAEEEKKLLSYRNKYLNLSVTNIPQSEEIAILIVDNSGNERTDINSKVASLAKSKHLNPVPGMFKVAFIKDGLMDKVLSGNLSYLKSLDIYKHVDNVVFGKVSFDTKINQELQGVLSTSASLEIKWIDCRQAGVAKSEVFYATGSGFSQSEAENSAINLLLNKMQTFFDK